MRIFLRLLTAVFLSVLVSGCASLMTTDFDDPDIEVVGLRPLPSSGMEARFEVSLRVVNPNSIGLDLDGVHYELYVEGSKLLSGVSSSPTTIPAYGEATLVLQAAASMFGSINLIQKLINKPPENGIGYELRAKLSIRNWPTAIRVQREGRIGEKAAAQVKT